MGGLDWNGLDVVVEMLGVTDVERLVRQLALIRERHNTGD